MKNSTQKILDEIEADQKRIASLTEEDLQKAYEKMKKSGFRTEDVLRFTYDIGSSPFVELHYHILCLDWDAHRYSRFDGWFERHLEKGYACLLSKLQDASYQKYRGQSLVLLAKVLSAGYGSDAPKQNYKRAARKIAREDLASDGASLRQCAVLCLNSLGALGDIPSLCDVLLHDPDSACRSYAASAFIHIASKEGKEGKTKAGEAAAAALKEALEHENKTGVLASVLGTVQFLFSKKYIPAYVTGENEGDGEKIREAREKALRFLNKRPIPECRNGKNRPQGRLSPAFMIFLLFFKIF